MKFTKNIQKTLAALTAVIFFTAAMSGCEKDEDKKLLDIPERLGDYGESRTDSDGGDNYNMNNNYINYKGDKGSNSQNTDYVQTEIENMQGKEEVYAQNLKRLNFENISFDDDLLIDLPQQIGYCSYKITESGSYVENFRDIFKYLDEDLDEEKIKPYDKKYDCIDYVNDDTDICAYLYSTGSILYSKGNFFERYRNSDIYVATYNLNQAAACGEKYPTADGTEVSPKEALDMVQELADDINDLQNAPYRHKAVAADLYLTAEGYYYYNVRFTSVLTGGGRIIEYGSMGTDTAAERIVSSEFDNAVVNGGSVCYYSQSGFLQPIGEIKPIEKTIGITDAALCLSRSLTPPIKYRISRVALEYRMTDVEKNRYVDSRIAEGRIYKSRPCWVFYVSEKNMQELYLIVDCIDNKVTIVDNNYVN